MKKEVRDRLIEKGVEELADALLEMAACDDRAEGLVRRLTASSEEKVKNFKAKVAGLKRMRRFVRSGKTYSRMDPAIVEHGR